MQPHRGVIERTFGRVARRRRLARDHAAAASALAFLALDAAMILVRPIARVSCDGVSYRVVLALGGATAR